MSRKQSLEVQRTKFLVPQNDRQKEYIKLIKSKVITFAIGPAGSSKTRTACSIALEELYNGKVDKIVITRPIRESEESLGFLPGDLSEKIQPYMVPIFGEFTESINQKELEALIRDGKIEMVPFAYMRGRNLKRAIVISDESQNCTDNQLKNLVTRICDGSRLVINGDLSQSDLLPHLQGGLERMINKLCDGTIDEIGLVIFDRSDIVRHPLISKILDKLEKNIVIPPIRDSWREYYDEESDD